MARTTDDTIARCDDGFDPAIFDCIADDPRLNNPRLIDETLESLSGAFDPRNPWPRDEDGGEA